MFHHARIGHGKPLLLPLVPLALALTATFLALDALALWGRAHPQMLNETACRMWPYVRFAHIAISTQLSLYVDRACLQPTGPMTASIVFFVAKTALALLAIPLAWLTIASTPHMARRLKRDCFRIIESYDSYRSALIRMSIGSLFSLLYPLVGIAVCGYTTVEGFGTSLIHKLIEDHFAFFVAGSGWGVSELVLWFALYPLRSDANGPRTRKDRFFT